MMREHGTVCGARQRAPGAPRPRVADPRAVPRYLDVVSDPDELDCLGCGVCCTGRPGTVLVDGADVERWRQIGRLDLVEALVPGHFGQLALPSDAVGRCVYQGTDDSPAACSIYALRPSVCAEVPVGGDECLAYRRRGGRE